VVDKNGGEMKEKTYRVRLKVSMIIESRSKKEAGEFAERILLHTTSIEDDVVVGKVELVNKQQGEK